MINPQDISVVVQGINIKDQTSKCLKSIRTYLPGATIIFSTYETEKTDGLDYDILVRSPDPGAERMTSKWYNNTNRILETSKAGLEQVKTKYVIRMRSDMIFANSKILNNIAKKFPKRDIKHSIFKERVLFYCLWNRYAEYVNGINIPRPFMLSDWFCFGLTQDVKDYYDCPLAKEPEYSRYFNGSDIFSSIVGVASWQYPVEQYICMKFFSRYFPLAKMKDSFDYDEAKLELSRKLLVNNIVSVDFNTIGVYIQKKLYKKVSKTVHKDIVTFKYPDWMQGVYTHSVFLHDYKKYCDNSLVIDENPVNKDILEHLHRHLYIFCKPFSQIPNIRIWLGDLVAIFYYSVRYIIQFIKSSLFRV